MAAKRQVSYQWRLREVMAAAGLFNASDLEPLLADRGITLSSVQVWCCPSLKNPMKAAFRAPTWGCVKAPQPVWLRGLGGDGAAGCG